MAVLLNFVAFQIGWFSAVVSAAALVPWLGVIAIASVICFHLYRVPRPRVELALILFCGALGGLWDSFLVTMGWVAYPSGMLIDGVAPYWIVMMWLLFATTLNASMAWMKGRPLLAAAFGLVGGPLSYVAGQKLDGIILVDATAALVALGMGWALMMPLLLVVADRCNGIDAAPLGDGTVVAK